MQQTNNIVKQTTTYTFKYGSDTDSIDLNTLLLSQIHFTTVLNEVKKKVAGDTDLAIKIRPLSKGSVPFDIILNVSWFHSLIEPAAVVLGIPTSIISAYVGIIQLRKWGKGRKMADIVIDGDKVYVRIGDERMEVDKIVYEISTQNAVVDKALTKGFEAIEKDEDVTNIELLDDKKKPLIKVERESFSSFTTPNESFSELTQTDPTRQEALTIFKVIFDKGYKWQFYLNGRKISASMPDAFMDSIKKGERFGYGDTLVVDLQIEKVFDKELNIFIEKDFKILNVVKHTPRPQQNNLFGNEEVIT